MLNRRFEREFLSPAIRRRKMEFVKRKLLKLTLTRVDVSFISMILSKFPLNSSLRCLEILAVVFKSSIRSASFFSGGERGIMFNNAGVACVFAYNSINFSFFPRSRCSKHDHTAYRNIAFQNKLKEI
jgi:hypothetical protein